MIGFSIEKALGKWYKYLALLVFGGIGGNIISAVISPYSIAVGASTSLYAVIGALCIWYYQHWHLLGPMRMQYLIFVGIMVGFSLLNGLTMAGSGIDSWGHLGGLIYGLLISMILLQTQNPQGVQ
jgi:rhomboid protease GluP